MGIKGSVVSIESIRHSLSCGYRYWELWMYINPQLNKVSNEYTILSCLWNVCLKLQLPKAFGKQLDNSYFMLTDIYVQLDKVMLQSVEEKMGEENTETHLFCSCRRTDILSFSFLLIMY